MSKRYESEADRIWKEKLDLCVSLREALTVLFAGAAIAGILLIATAASAVA